MKNKIKIFSRYNKHLEKEGIINLSSIIEQMAQFIRQ